MAATLLGALLAASYFYFQGSAVNPLYGIPPHWHLVVGGLAFGLVFMATDPVSAAHTFPGQWAYGLLIGVLTIMIRVVNPAYPEGIMLAILLGNVFAPLFDYFVVRANIRRRVMRHGR
jgi:Na+-transporting NADH:ubiquinone oxidoreductase subunit B